MRFLCWAIVACSIFFSCSQMEKPQTGPNTPVAKYFNYGDTSVQTAGIRMIPSKLQSVNSKYGPNGSEIIRG